MNLRTAVGVMNILFKFHILKKLYHVLYILSTPFNLSQTPDLHTCHINDHLHTDHTKIFFDTTFKKLYGERSRYR